MSSCPTCDEPLEANGVLGENACSTCGGRLLDPTATETFIDAISQSRDGLLALHASAAATSTSACPSCAAPRFAWFTLRDRSVGLCASCGALWLEKGALSALSEGRFEELAVTPRPHTDFGDRAVLLVERGVADDVLRTAASSARRTAREIDVAVKNAATGVFLETLSAPAADVVVAALVAAGIRARAATRDEYRAPGVVETRELAAADGGLVVRDALGRDRVLGWDRVIAAGAGLAYHVADDLGAIKYKRQRGLGGRVMLIPTRQASTERKRNPFVDVAVLDDARDFGRGKIVRFRFSQWRSTTPGAGSWLDAAGAVLRAFGGRGIALTDDAAAAMSGKWPDVVVEGWADRSIGWLLWRSRA